MTVIHARNNRLSQNNLVTSCNCTYDDAAEAHPAGVANVHSVYTTPDDTEIVNGDIGTEGEGLKGQSIQSHIGSNHRPFTQLVYKWIAKPEHPPAWSDLSGRNNK